MKKILLATNNQGKVQELRSLIYGKSWEFTTPAEQGIDISVNETGVTFEANAVLKAKAYAKVADMITLADDSGLEVNALNGEPGVFSARYGRPDATDKERYEYLLSNLSEVPWENRKARFRCVVAITFPDGELVLCKGDCPGIIAFEPKGENGFGYDPIFWLPAFNKTMAELTIDEKNEISHRGKAARQAQLFLTDVLEKLQE